MDLWLWGRGSLEIFWWRLWKGLGDGTFRSNAKEEKNMDITGSFQITEPCHESWNKMTPEAQGRFCASCQRCVVDFTAKTPEQIKLIYEQEGGDVCGRVRASQLNATARPAVRGIAPRILRSLRPVQMFALALAGAFTFLFHSPVKAQKEMIMGKIAYVAPTATITGRVTWEGGNLPAGNVTVEARQHGSVVASTTTDALGRYTLTNVPGRCDLITVAGPHDTQGSAMISLNGRNTLKQNLVLQDVMVLGEMEYVPEILPDYEEHLDSVGGPDGGDEAGSSENPDEGQGRLATTEEGLEAPIKVGEFELTVFPNPTSAQVTVRMDKVGTGLLSMSLIDAQGQEVIKGAWAPFMEVEQTLDVSALAAGIYIIRVQSGDVQVERRFIKE